MKKDLFLPPSCLTLVGLSHSFHRVPLGKKLKQILCLHNISTQEWLPLIMKDFSPHRYFTKCMYLCNFPRLAVTLYTFGFSSLDIPKWNFRTVRVAVHGLRLIHFLRPSSWICISKNMLTVANIKNTWTGELGENRTAWTRMLRSILCHSSFSNEFQTSRDYTFWPQPCLMPVFIDPRDGWFPVFWPLMNHYICWAFILCCFIYMYINSDSNSDF